MKFTIVKSQLYQKLIKTVSILLIMILTVVVLVYAKSFLVPVAFAGILSMLLLPVTNWLQKKGINKAFSAVLPVLMLIAFFGLIIFFVANQIAGITEDSAKLEQQLSSKYQEAKKFVAEKFNISPEQQQQMAQEQQKSAPGKMQSMVTGFLTGLGSLLSDIIITLVYIFLFIYFRGRIRNFILKLVSKEDQPDAVDTINKARKVAQQYLSGLFLMIIFLWVMYSIGFAIAGVKNFIFFAVLCGLLEIIPFIGNLLGTGLTIAMSLVQGGGTNMVIAILITYAIVQFVQTYLLEPLVVGAEVSINPLFTIIGLVAGETLWGIPGMVLAIPLLGIAKIICDHVEPLKPYGYLIGQDKKDSTSRLKKKMKGLGKKWFG